MTRRRAPAAAVTLCLIAAVPPTGAAADAGSLMGEWVLRPLDLTLGNGLRCRYRQTIDIRRRVGPGRYRGTAVYRYDCGGTRFGDTRVRITIDVNGKTLRLGSPDPNWIDEQVERVAPDRMEGHDVRDHYRIIYHRPKGKPLS